MVLELIFSHSQRAFGYFAAVKLIEKVFGKLLKSRWYGCMLFAEPFVFVELLYEFLLGFCKVVGAGIDVVTIRAQPYLVVIMFELGAGPAAVNSRR